MGLTQNLGRLSPSITSDASLNVGIGGAPSGSYKFEVTGASATNNVYVQGDGAYTGGALFIKQYASGVTNITGYNLISSQTSGHYFSSSQGGSFKNFLFDPSSLTDATLRSYTLPDASGTIALTSNLSSYLPLAGGTLTGALNGTTATFSGLTVSGTSDIYPEIKTSAADADALLGFSNTGDGNNGWGIGRRNTGEFWIANYTGNFLSGTRTVPFQLATSGAATFSSTITATGAIKTFRTSGSTYLQISAEAGAGTFESSNGYIYFNRTPGDYTNPNLMIDGANNRVGIGTSSPSGILDVSKNQNATTNIYFRNTDNTNASSRMYLNLVAGNTSAGLAVLAGGSGTGDFYIGGNNGGNTYFQPYLGGGVTMTLTNAGNVLIGTTANLGSELNVNNTIRVGVAFGSQANITFGDSGTPYWTVGRNAGSGNLTISSYATTAMTIIPTSGNVLIGTSSDNGYKNQIIASTYGLYISVGSTSSHYPLNIENSGFTALFRVRADGLIMTGTNTLSPYNFTTGTGANMVVDSSGYLYRSTSSLKYKTNVTDYDKGLDIINKIRPVYYNSKNNGNTLFAGLIAEDIHELGLSEFVQYAEDGSPDALSYSNMVALLIKGIQELKQEIDELKNK
jgi:hypothetical protein